MRSVTVIEFDLGPLLDTGVMLLGRTTWELFSTLWPNRTDPFSTKMNAIPKLVASRSLTTAGAWQNSTVLDGDLVETVRAAEQDIVVTGSVGIVHTLAAADLVDEYRLIVFPAVLGTGRRLFADGAPPARLRLDSVEQKGQGAFLRYTRA